MELRRKTNLRLGGMQKLSLVGRKAFVADGGDGLGVVSVSLSAPQIISNGAPSPTSTHPFRI